MRSIILAVALLSFSYPAFADKLVGCTVKATKVSTNATKKSMAKVTKEAAEKAALAKAGAGMRISETDLEVEDGCLVYSIELKGEGKGKHEILVDAGDGRILSHRQAGVKGAVEKVKDKLTPNK